MLGINKKISSYNHSSRNGNGIKYIVIHYTGNRGDTAKNNVDYFYNGDKSASAHYFVDDNSIWQSVEDCNSAWSVGDGRGRYGITNSNSISIEMCCQSNGEVSTRTENNTLELTKYLMNKYGVSIDRVVRHYDASRKICPNWSANGWSRWNNFKAKLGGINVTVTSAPSTNNTHISTHLRDLQGAYNADYHRSILVDGIRGQQVENMLHEICIGIGNNKPNVTAWIQCRVGADIDGIYGRNTANTVKRFQQENGLSCDGVVGYNTLNKILEKFYW